MRQLLNGRFPLLLGRLLRQQADTPILGGWGAVIGLLVLVVFFSIFSPSFRQQGNLILITQNAAITIGIVAIGQTVVLISGGIDLSVSATIALTGLLSAWLMKYGVGPIPPLTGNWCYLAIGAGWLVGVLIGAAQGWLITYRQMPAFIVTLGTMVGLNGLALAFSKGAIVYGLPSEFRWISEGRVGIIPAPVLIMLSIYILTAYMLRRTKIGRYCYAIGGNETAARLAGVQVDRYRIYFYAYSGLLAAVTGTILISFIDAAIYYNGEGYQFRSVAAAIMGGTSLTGGVGGLWGTMIGVAILSVIPSGMVMLNAPSWWQDVITGAIIIFAVVVDTDRTRARKATVRIEASQTVSTGRYLYELLESVAQKIEKHTGSSLCRVFMVDRDTGDLVSQEIHSANPNIPELSILTGKSKIVSEAKETGNVVLIQDLARTGYHRVMPMLPEVQSALALPLMVRERCIGVIELQSPGVAVFDEDTIETLDTLTRPLHTMLEDAWLLESGWVVRQVRDALRHLWDSLYLGRMELIDWALPEHDMRRERTPGARGEILRSLLLHTIESLRPPEDRDLTHEFRSHRILSLTYVQEQAVEQILQTLHISRRQYFYDLKDSIEVLADILVRNHGSRASPER